jgi:hypothetical protein
MSRKAKIVVLNDPHSLERVSLRICFMKSAGEGYPPEERNEMMHQTAEWRVYQRRSSLTTQPSSH